jgi:amidohydrolase
MPVKNRFAEMHAEIVEWRRDIHANPELMFDVQRTAAKVEGLLRDFGCDEIVTGLGRTGVVGVIRGKTDTGGRVIGLRADMDALPVHEATGLEFASVNEGKMHACGHDGHTAMLLGAAKYLAETRNFDGTAVVIFQPAEEGGGGGREMVQDGLMDRFGIQEIYGQHNMPGYPVGEFAIRPGAMMAAADQFDIVVTGRGGHAAKPEDAVDTVLVASQIVVALQSIASRNVNPLQEVVLSICGFTTESTVFNVIPQTVRLIGTVRTMDSKVQDLVIERMERLISSTAQAYGATAELDYQRGYPQTVNAVENAAYAADVARSVTGNATTEAEPMMAAEDFSYMLNERPGAYIFLGNGDTKMLHHPEYNFDEDAIPYGCSWLAGMVEVRMPAK